MGQKTETRQRIYQCRRCPAAKQLNDQRRPEMQEQKTHNHGHHKGDDLIARAGRHATANGEIAAGQHQTAQIAGEDNAIVRIAQIIDGKPDRECQR